MKIYGSIGEYYKAFGHSPPKVDYFDVRRFQQYYEEDNPGVTTFEAEPFRVEFYGIGLLNEGTAKTYLGKSFRANICFYSPYQILSWNGVDNNWKGYYLLFDQDYLSRCSFGGTFLTDFPFLRLDNVHPIFVSDEQISSLSPFFENIYNEFNSENADKFALIESYLRLLLLQIRRITASLSIVDTDVRSRAETSIVAQYSALIEAHLAQPELAKEFASPVFYADRLNIHPNHLNAVVKRVTNKTAKQLIHEVIMTAAKSLLSQSQKSVKEISFQLGFDQVAHFNNLFKKHTALTPLQYRQISR
jgi:AraC family transcriptional activator of pobA